MKIRALHINSMLIYVQNDFIWVQEMQEIIGSMGYGGLYVCIICIALHIKEGRKPLIQTFDKLKIFFTT